ncbi:MAG: hypothetical protein J6Y62_04495 [Clostridia bacterium]|nr:hypothetical protein [Clostridia bacterium]
MRKKSDGKLVKTRLSECVTSDDLRAFVDWGMSGKCGKKKLYCVDWEKNQVRELQPDTDVQIVFDGFYFKARLAGAPEGCFLDELYCDELEARSRLRPENSLIDAYEYKLYFNVHFNLWEMDAVKTKASAADMHKVFRAGVPNSRHPVFFGYAEGGPDLFKLKADLKKECAEYLTAEAAGLERQKAGLEEL